MPNNPGSDIWKQQIQGFLHLSPATRPAEP
jgi:hypothetical protein